LSSAANEEIIHKGQNMEIKGRKFVCWLKQPAKANLKIRERSKGAIYNFVHVSMIQNKSKHQNGGNDNSFAPRKAKTVPLLLQMSYHD
jgi:hypothetical protein